MNENILLGRFDPDGTVRVRVCPAHAKFADVAALIADAKAKEAIGVPQGESLDLTGTFDPDDWCCVVVKPRHRRYRDLVKSLAQSKSRLVNRAIQMSGAEQPITDDDAKEEICHLYAQLWNIIEANGGVITYGEYHAAHDELEGGSWRLHHHDGEWHVEKIGPGGEVVELAGAERRRATGYKKTNPLVATNSRGEVHTYWGGMFIPSDAVIQGTAEEVKARGEQHNQQTQNAHEERTKRGPADTASTAGRLAKLAGGRELNQREKISAARMFHGFHQHHGENTAHRLDELSHQVAKGLEKNKNNGDLKLRAAQLHHALGMHLAKYAKPKTEERVPQEKKEPEQVETPPIEQPQVETPEPAKEEPGKEVSAVETPAVEQPVKAKKPRKEPAPVGDVDTHHAALSSLYNRIQNDEQVPKEEIEQALTAAGKMKAPEVKALAAKMGFARKFRTKADSMAAIAQKLTGKQFAAEKMQRPEEREAGYHLDPSEPNSVFHNGKRVATYSRKATKEDLERVAQTKSAAEAKPQEQAAKPNDDAMSGRIMIPGKWSAGVSPEEIAKNYGLPKDFYKDGRSVHDSVMYGEVLVNDKYDPDGLVAKAVNAKQSAYEQGLYKGSRRKHYDEQVQAALAAAVKRASEASKK
jgi:hypothetical protein